LEKRTEENKKMAGIQVLSQGVGYGIVVGIGGFFALLMLGLTYLQNKYTSYSTHQAEEFNTASRSVKPGLIAAGIVSSWTWVCLCSQFHHWIRTKQLILH